LLQEPSMYIVKAVLILDNDGNRLVAKVSLQEQIVSKIYVVSKKWVAIFVNLFRFMHWLLGWMYNVHSVQPVVASDPLAWCVGLSVMQLCCATAERMEVLFRMEISGPKSHCISPDPSVARGCSMWSSPNYYGLLLTLSSEILIVLIFCCSTMTTRLHLQRSRRHLRRISLIRPIVQMVSLCT